MYKVNAQRECLQLLYRCKGIFACVNVLLRALARLIHGHHSQSHLLVEQDDVAALDLLHQQIHHRALRRTA